MPAYYDIRRIAIDNATWTACTPPRDCTSLRVTLETSPSNLKIRTDAADAQTEKLIASGFELTIAGNPGSAGAIPFGAGLPVFWMQSITGTGPAVVEFIR